MRLVVIFLFSMSFAMAQKPQAHKYWEDLNQNDQKKLTAQPFVNNDARDFLYDSFKASDDDRTFALLDILVKAKGQSLPLYFFLFNKILKPADGALAEVMGTYCYKMLHNHPVYVIRYFGKIQENLQNRRSLENIYAKFLAEEFYFEKMGCSEIKEPFGTFKKHIRSLKSYSSSPDFKRLTDSFLKRVDFYFKNITP